MRSYNKLFNIQRNRIHNSTRTHTLIIYFIIPHIELFNIFNVYKKTIC